MERPVGITIVAVLIFLEAALATLLAVLILALGTTGSSSADVHAPSSMAGITASGAVTAIYCVLFAALAVVTGMGLLRLREWGRKLTIAICILGVVASGVGTMRVSKLALDMGYIAIGAYLMLPRVKRAFAAG